MPGQAAAAEGEVGPHHRVAPPASRYRERQPPVSQTVSPSIPWRRSLPHRGADRVVEVGQDPRRGALEDAEPRGQRPIRGRTWIVDCGECHNFES